MMQFGKRLGVFSTGIVGIMWSGKEPRCEDLFTATQANNTACMRALLSSGVPANSNEIAKVESSPNQLVPYRGWTPLHIAAFHGHTEAAETLINSGADVNATDKFRHHNDVIWQMLPNRNATSTQVLDGVETVKNLRERHFDSDGMPEGSDKNFLNSTPLHYAALKGNLEMVEQLLDSGADPTVRNVSGQTASDLTTDKRVKTVLTARQNQLETPLMAKYIYG